MIRSYMDESQNSYAKRGPMQEYTLHDSINVKFHKIKTNLISWGQGPGRMLGGMDCRGYM